MPIDMHVHSTKSGHASWKPKKIVNEIKKIEGIDGFALTDHDTGEGIEEAVKAGDKKDVVVVPGMEMCFKYSSKEGVLFEGEVLAYFIDPNYRLLERIVERCRESRENRDITLFNLAKYKFEISLNESLDWAVKKDMISEDKAGSWEKRGAPDRNILRKFLEDKGYLPKGKGHEIIKDPSSGLYVEREKTPLDEVSMAIYGAGGIPIFAHPGLTLQKEHVSFDCFKKFFLPVILDQGIMGFEIYPYHMVEKGVSEKTSTLWNIEFGKINIDNDLINGVKGSDFHMPSYEVVKGKLTEKITLGRYVTSDYTFERLKNEAMKNKSL